MRLHPTVRPVLLVILLRVSLLVALAASAVLVIEYQSVGDPTFCGAGSSCAEVRNSQLSRDILRMVGVTLPQVGLAAYVLLLGFSLMATSRLHDILLAVIAGIGAVCGAALLVVQSRTIGVFCPWCVVVDVAAIVAALAAILLAIFSPGRAASPPAAPLATDPAAAGDAATADRPPAVISPADPPPWSAGNIIAVWVVAAGAAVALPFIWSEYRPVAPPPPALAGLQSPDRITVIEFTDFECPHCRALHPALVNLKQTYGDRIDFTRKMVPLDFHKGALPAARAYVCTPEDKREAMADALYRAPSVELNRPGTVAIAKELGVDGAAFERCLDAPATKQALEKDRQLFDALGTSGVPQTYVRGQVILGNNPEKLFKAVDRAAGGSRPELPLPLLYVLLGLIFAAVGVFTSWASRPREAPRNGSRTT